jgi:hypothetical protein
VLAIALLLAVVVAALGGVRCLAAAQRRGHGLAAGATAGAGGQGHAKARCCPTRFAAERLVVRWDAGRQSVAIDGLLGSGLQLALAPRASASLAGAAGASGCRRGASRCRPARPGRGRW